MDGFLDYLPSSHSLDTLDPITEIYDDDQLETASYRAKSVPRIHFAALIFQLQCLCQNDTVKLDRSTLNLKAD